ncbi:MAG: glycogen synthase [Flavobacteriaceae bacterium]|nr:MAG: glycogen synthase [Flavobacteriaceae bacterium]
MPRFGTINERRYQLHEVIRLSGMNLVINDMDQPLIIKVASLPNERMQVYFIDNEEYFKRKGVYGDPKGNFFEDNDERIIFFAKGVLETVKKLNWKPDVIHIHGWMGSLLPLYLKKYYADDLFFQGAKVFTSIFDQSFDGTLSLEMIEKLAYDGFESSDIAHLSDPVYGNLIKQAIDYSDALILVEETSNQEIKTYIKKEGISVLEIQENLNIAESYIPFYKSQVVGEENS